MLRLLLKPKGRVDEDVLRFDQVGSATRDRAELKRLRATDGWVEPFLAADLEPWDQCRTDAFNFPTQKHGLFRGITLVTIGLLKPPDQTHIVAKVPNLSALEVDTHRKTHLQRMI